MGKKSIKNLVIMHCNMKLDSQKNPIKHFKIFFGMFIFQQTFARKVKFIFQMKPKNHLIDYQN